MARPVAAAMLMPMLYFIWVSQFQIPYRGPPILSAADKCAAMQPSARMGTAPRRAAHPRCLLNLTRRGLAIVRTRQDTWTRSQGPWIDVTETTERLTNHQGTSYAAARE